PSTALIATIARAVAKVSLRACSANGSRRAARKAALPGRAASTARAASGSTTISPRYDRVTPRKSRAGGEISPERAITSPPPHLLGEDARPEPLGAVDLLLDHVPAAEVGHREEPRRQRLAGRRRQALADRPEAVVDQDR